MQFITSKNFLLQAALVLPLISSTLAAPLSASSSKLVTRDAGNMTSVAFNNPKMPSTLDHGLTRRQEGVDPAAVAEEVLNIAKTVFDWVQDINNAQHEAESAFTQNTIDQLLAYYPGKNAIIFHDQDSTTDFVNGVHQHYELDLPSSPGTQGYEIFVLDSGTFTRAGDGGYLNWCFGGSYDYPPLSNTVTFYQQ